MYGFELPGMVFAFADIVFQSAIIEGTDVL